MNYFSMFSGVGGFEKGIEDAYDEITQSQDKDLREPTATVGSQDGRGEQHREQRDEGLSCDTIQRGDASSNSDGLLGNALLKSKQEQQQDGRVERPQLTCVGFSEIDKHAISVYKYHYPEARNYGDATTINPDDIPDFDLLVGGFPCQSFSLAGKRRGFEDTRGTLFYEIARIAQSKRPRLLVLENVKGLLSHDKGKTFATILAALWELGYEYQYGLVNSRYFGVPQNRERIIIVAHLRGTPRPEVFPLCIAHGTHLEEDDGKTRYEDFGSSIPEIGQAERVYGKNGNIPPLNTGWTPNIIHGTLTEAIGTRQEGVTSRENQQQYVEKAATIRRLTPTECERLQAFPDGWTEFGINEKGEKVKISDTQRYKMMGNAVTTSVIKAVMMKITEQRKGDE